MQLVSPSMPPLRSEWSRGGVPGVPREAAEATDLEEIWPTLCVGGLEAQTQEIQQFQQFSALWMWHEAASFPFRMRTCVYSQRWAECLCMASCNGSMEPFESFQALCQWYAEAPRTHQCHLRCKCLWDVWNVQAKVTVAFLTTQLAEALQKAV